MNLRLVLTGIALIVLAAIFFFGMGAIAPRSNDPVEMMRTVGMVSGGGAGMGAVMVLIGLLRRRKTPAG